MEKIFITGCAKSGTTLLKRMFHAFSKTYVIVAEAQLYNFAKLLPEEVTKCDFLVGKRTWETIFSSSRISKKQIENQKKLIKRNNIHIINIVRDGRDVVISYMKDWGINGCFEWMECVRQAQNEFIEHSIRYEDLIMNPDVVQAAIINKFGLEPCAKFSEYPMFVPENYNLEDPKINENYTPRPLDKSKIGKDIDFYRTLSPNDIDFFHKLLKTHGYIN